MPKRVARPKPVSRSEWTAAVREGWNSVSYRYRPSGKLSDFFGHHEGEYRRWLDPILRAVPRGANVLDLGCGNGVPTARILSRRFRVIGVDLSDVQVRRARRLVPSARFVRADMCQVVFAPEAFAAIVSLYSLIHVPRADQRPLVRRIASWLAPGGWFLAIVGHDRYEGSETGWLGSEAPMLWSHYDAATYRRWLRELKFTIAHEEFIPEGGGGHQLFLAQKAPSSPAPRAG